MITEQRLRFYVSDETIFHYYFGDFEIGTKYSSPLRRDPKPSFVISEYEGRLFWKDFGIEDIERHDAIGFVQQKFKISRKEAVLQIWNDFLAGGASVPTRKRSLNIGLPYDMYHRDLEPEELKYWKKHCIDEHVLRFFSVRGLDGLYRHGKELWTSTRDDPAYVYLFGPHSYKIYRPLSVDRFRSQGVSDVLEGYAQLPMWGRKLIITSSFKDAIVLSTLGYPACAPSSESASKALLAKARELGSRFQDIYILYDNDAPGIRAALSIAKATGWRPVFIPREYGKDPAEVVLKSSNRFLLNKILNKCIT